VDDLNHNEIDATSILKSLGAHYANPRRAIRITLGVFASLQLLLAVPWIFGANLLTDFADTVGQAHLTRDGALGLFVGAAGLITAIKSRYAAPAAVIAGIGVVVQLVAGAFDEHHAHVDGWFELLHLLTVGILILTAILAGSRAGRPRQPQRQQGPRLLSRDVTPDPHQRDVA
jgi:hypothetical protein